MVGGVPEPGPDRSGPESRQAERARDLPGEGAEGGLDLVHVVGGVDGIDQQGLRILGPRR